jgi:glutamine amidotransferase
MQTIAVIDYGMGNLRSVVNALEQVAPEQRIVLTSNPQDIAAAERVVFPGQGAAGDCMRAIESYGLRDAVIEAATEKPFLGICMGLQVLVDHSEENQGTDCLGVFRGQVRYFGDSHRDPDGVKLKVPHMGWNRVMQTRRHPLWESIEDGSRFYFVHSYYVEMQDPQLVVGQCEYGFDFVCAIARGNLFALQCHPEKSAAVGLQLLANFAGWDGRE